MVTSGAETIWMERVYEAVIRQHFREDRQMLFLSGPRQVGKTTTARTTAAALGEYRYFSWDDDDDRMAIVGGPARVAADMGLHRLHGEPPVALFDEIHHFRHWRTFLKGLFDAHPGELRILVTGSARLDVLRKGGRGLMGRYFPYRMHPLSLAELIDPRPRDEKLIGPPRAADPGALDTLVRFGGFPEPLTRQSERFSRRWGRLRMEQLIREDLRDITRIQEIGQVAVLAELLKRRVGQLVSMASLAREVKATITTVSRWLDALSALYYCFPVRPFSRNVARSLRKEPKFYLWDWSSVPDPGARTENLVAAALLKACHFWTDHGLGDCSLFFLRDKEKREVDFLVTLDDRPYLLVEAKTSAPSAIPPALHHFQAQTGAPHALVAAFDLPYVDRDCFDLRRPAVVPAATLLSQLV
jgi:predicted AAA+ superfamily ATPase